jgi:hypothetical protein
MPIEKNKVPMSEREWRRRYIQMLRVEVGLLDPPDESGRMLKPTPKSAAARRRVVELLHLDAGDPPPQWKDTPREKPEPIDDSPWRELRQASLRAQYERVGRHGLAFARDGTLRCVACKEVVLAVPRGGAFAIGAPVSALAERHRAQGCR